MKTSFTTKILWAVFIALLLVLLPHTAWAFGSMEPAGNWFTSWVAAIAFEMAIAVLTHKLAKHIETTAKIKGRWTKFGARYLNPFSLGLILATLVSALANLAHAVEFGKPLAIFTAWGIPQGVYSFAFGGVLPFVSLIFARVLSNVTEDEGAPDPEVVTLKQTIGELNRRLKESEAQRKASEEQVNSTILSSEQQVNTIIAKSETRVKAIEANAQQQVNAAEDRARDAEARFNAAGDLMRALFSGDKRERILEVHRQWPQLTGNAIAVITESSPAHVSQVLKEVEVIDAN